VRAGDDPPAFRRERRLVPALRDDATDAAARRWSRKGPVRQRPSSFQYLLDLDVDLAEELDVRMRMVARPAVTAMTFDVDAGDLAMSKLLTSTVGGPGVLVLDGVIAVNASVGGRMATELVGAGDLLQRRPVEDDALLACEISWRALVSARFAVLDLGFAQRVQPWPQITSTLLRRAGRRAHNLDVQRAIAAQPRLEVRLWLLLWHLAGRWGKVEPGGVRLSLPLTHQLLGRLVGAERPSVSHALARLAHPGLISGHGDEWHLHGNLESQLATMLEPADQRIDDLAGSIAAARPR
jgi:CRP/FNR family transcriptional regulator, cyclic AMP receptor protein